MLGVHRHRPARLALLALAVASKPVSDDVGHNGCRFVKVRIKQQAELGWAESFRGGLVGLNEGVVVVRREDGFYGRFGWG